MFNFTRRKLLAVHTLRMFRKLEVKTMIIVLDETSHFHSHILGPPTPPAATVLLFCVGQFQPGAPHVEEVLPRAQVSGRPVQEEVRAGSQSLWLSARTTVAAQQSELSFGGSDPLAEILREIPQKSPPEHKLIEPLAWRLFQKFRERHCLGGPL